MIYFILLLLILNDAALEWRDQLRISSVQNGHGLYTDTASSGFAVLPLLLNKENIAITGRKCGLKAMKYRIPLFILLLKFIKNMELLRPIKLSPSLSCLWEIITTARPE